MLFGAHVSTSKGLDAAVDYAVSVGCECLQLFAKSPRQWRGKPIDPDNAAAFLAARERHAFGPVFTHTAYLINLATTDPVLRARSIQALADELVRGAVLGADGVVTHLGNDPDDDPALAAARVADAVIEAYAAAGEGASTTRLLLENTAGAGRTFGSTIEQLCDVMDHAALPPERLGICFDTCHGFAYGYPVDTAEGWREVVDTLHTRCGVGRLGLIHANDCLFERGSRRDRHAWIGEGHIGSQGFAAMVRTEELAGVAVVTEMPGEVPDKDRVNIERLATLRGTR